MKETRTGNKKGNKRLTKTNRIFAVLLMAFLLLSVQTVSAAVKAPSSVKLNRTSATTLIGKSFSLVATVSPADAEDTKVTWKSSNPNVATVSKKGRVKVVGVGTTKITAQTSNKKKAVCTVKGVSYTVKNGTVTVATPDGTRAYHAYDQTAYTSYYNSYGCVTAAVSIAASGFGQDFSPKKIHEGKVSEKFSERYALNKMKASSALYGKAALSVWTGSTILSDLGIKNTPVYQYTNKQAEKDITKHLKAGKPVIIKATNKVHNGIRLANGHHAIVLVGIDDKGYLTWINPKPGRVNYAHAKGYEQYCSLTLADLLKYHMEPAKGNYKTPFVTNMQAAGGYILVG